MVFYFEIGLIDLLLDKVLFMILKTIVLANSVGIIYIMVSIQQTDFIITYLELTQFIALLISMILLFL